MNILELCLSPGLGGLELYVYRSSTELSGSNYQRNNVLAVLHDNSKLDNYFNKNSNIRRHHLKRFFHLFPLLNAIKLANIIDKENIDVIHMHWGKDLPLAAFGKLFSERKPALIYTRQMMITRAKKDPYHNFLYRQMSLLLTITRELETLCKKFISIPSDKIKTLYYGVKPPEHFLSHEEFTKQRESLGFSSEDFVAGLIGRLEESKGQHLLIEAVHKAKQNNQQIKALIVGHEMTPGYREELKTLATELDVLNNIVFQDFVTRPQMLMQLCDCVILASGQETFGLVLPEAMRSGVAVIGSNNGGVPEIIDHEETGLLFETKNTESLYQQLDTLYSDSNLKGMLATNGKTKADEVFNSEIHFHTLETVFSQMSGSPS